MAHRAAVFLCAVVMLIAVILIGVGSKDLKETSTSDPTLEDLQALQKAADTTPAALTMLSPVSVGASALSATTVRQAFASTNWSQPLSIVASAPARTGVATLAPPGPPPVVPPQPEMNLTLTINGNNTVAVPVVLFQQGLNAIPCTAAAGAYCSAASLVTSCAKYVAGAFYASDRMWVLNGTLVCNGTDPACGICIFQKRAFDLCVVVTPTAAGAWSLNTTTVQSCTFPYDAPALVQYSSGLLADVPAFAANNTQTLNVTVRASTDAVFTIARTYHGFTVVNELVLSHPSKARGSALLGIGIIALLVGAAGMAAAFRAGGGSLDGGMPAGSINGGGYAQVPAAYGAAPPPGQYVSVPPGYGQPPVYGQGVPPTWGAAPAPPQQAPASWQQ
jgi:hypothetical protein